MNVISFISTVLFLFCGLCFFCFLCFALLNARENGHGASGDDEDKPAVPITAFDLAPDKEDNHRKNRNDGVQGFLIHNQLDRTALIGPGAKSAF